METQETTQTTEATAKAERLGEGTNLRFTITDEKGAVWLLRKLRAISEERDAIKAATVQRVAELDADEKQLTHLYGEQLRAWVEGETERRRRQTITLPLAGMQLAFRKSAAAALFVAAPVKVAVETWFEKTGEVLPGFDRKPEGQSFTWKPIKAGKPAEGVGETEVLEIHRPPGV